MPPRPQHFPQTFPYSCVPACILTVLTSYGVTMLEYEVRAICKCDETGTTPSNAVVALKELGFDLSFVANFEFEELKSEVAFGLLPITYLRFAEGITHAVVVHDI